jgi:NAD(P)-dependent dehydrogenase (short-subunit alcohol dehydrogenase family)
VNGPFDWNGRTVLVTGGTRGIGLETALTFGRAGARVALTYRWGGSEDEALARFAAEGLAAPRIVQADVASEADTDRLLAELKNDTDRIDGFVSNVALASLVRGLDDYKLRGLQRSIEYTAWPLVAYTMRIHAACGAYPRYVVGLSSLGNTHVGLHYDFVAASKAVLESLLRYLAWRLGPEGVRVNGVTCGLVRTESSVGAGGEEYAAFEAWHERVIGPIPYVAAEHVARAIFGLCSGWMDGLNGQIVTVDDTSMTFAENRYGLYRASLRRNSEGEDR